MKLPSRWLSSLLVAGALASPLVMTGCAERGYYRVYDPYYRDYHRWGPDEDRYYHRWAAENHREDRDFRALDRDDQKRYWDWRHNHADHDNDRH